MRLPRRRAERDGADPAVLAAALRTVRERLQAGGSLRDALEEAGRGHASPLAAIASSLTAGRPLQDALAGAVASADDLDLRASLCVLAAQVRAGGDPAPAIAAVEARLRRRASAEREARALTTQARLSARAMLWLTPGFLSLIFALDPRATWSSLQRPAARVALASGILLQLLGGAWIRRIVLRPTSREPSRVGLSRRLPVVRAVAAVVAGRPDPGRAVAGDVARAAEVHALLLGAGLSVPQALDVAAPLVPGAFGDALRSVAAKVRAGVPLSAALAVAADGFETREPRRFVEAIESSRRLGLPAAKTLGVLAEDVADAEAARVAEEVRGASVKVLLPLALLVLPAFVLACLVPLFIGGLEGLNL